MKISTKPNDPNNWPRKLARKHPGITAAIEALESEMDDANRAFAMKEFMDEREKMNGRGETLILQLKQHRDAIGKSRDALRDLQGEIESLLEPTERGIDALDEAISALSEQA